VYSFQTQQKFDDADMYCFNLLIV